MTAAEVKAALRLRHPAARSPLPGPWTCVEEFRSIDFLAIKAWRPHSRIGYEVKVSRSDFRNEIMRPSKRFLNVKFCHEFYFAVPDGLLTPEEISFDTPVFAPADFVGQRCPAGCQPYRGKKTYKLRVPVPTIGYGKDRWVRVVCPTCKGKGYISPSRVEQQTPKLWVPNDVGLVVIKGKYAGMVKPAPKNKPGPMSDADAARLVRWTSIRPDPRHIPRAGD